MSLAIAFRGVYRGWAIAAPGANTNAFTAVEWPSDRICRATIQLTTESVVNLAVTRGGTAKLLGLNAHVAVPVDGVHAFNVPGLAKGDMVSVQVETDGGIDMVALDEVL